MKHNVDGFFEHGGRSFCYTSEIYTGDDACMRDRVGGIVNDRSEMVGADLWDLLSDRVLKDAHERLRYCTGPDAIKDDETLDEYLCRMAKVWHPEELEDGLVRTSKHEVMYVRLSFDGASGVLDDLINSGIAVDAGYRQVLAAADTLVSKREDVSGKTKDVIAKICAKIEADGFDGDVIIYS